MKGAGSRPPARQAPKRKPRPKPRQEPSLDLSVLDRGRPRTSLAFLRSVVRTTLRFAKRPTMPVSLLLTDDAEIARLHARHLGEAAPTDVISFEIDGGAEIVVSVETASRMARKHGHPVRAEIALYIAHGILHTTGYDDLRVRDRVRMRVAERVVMQRLRLRVHAVDA